MAKIKNNRDMFAQRGNPWETELPTRKPRLSPVTGKLTVERKAHIFGLRHGLIPDKPKPEDNPDWDRLFADHCIPIQDRLDRERNHFIPSMKSASSKPTSTGRIVANAKLRMLQKRASNKVKV